MNQKGCSIESTIPGLYDLTIFENSVPVKVVRSIRLENAIQIMEKEMKEERK